MNAQQPLGPNPEWEQEDDFHAAYRAAGYGDNLFDQSLYYRMDQLLDTAMWDEETKHEFGSSLPFEMTNGEMLDVIDYLWEHQPRTPFSEVKNPSQKEITAFIRKVCNL
jgi:hypothetical protein